MKPSVSRVPIQPNELLMAYLDIGQPLVANRRNNVGEEGDSEEDDIGVPGLKVVGQTNAIGILEDVQGRDQHLRRTEVDRQGDGDLTGEIAPATDPGGHATTPRGREGGSLVVNTTGRGID